MSIYLSAAMLLIAIFLCARPVLHLYRIFFAIAVLGWGAFVIVIYENALIRVASELTSSKKSTNEFNAGILAYNDVLFEPRVSIALLLLSLALFVFFPVRRKPK